LNVVLQKTQNDSISHISVVSVIDRLAMQVLAEQYDLGYKHMP
jgi:hypothetical protein